MYMAWKGLRIGTLQLGLMKFSLTEGDHQSRRNFSKGISHTASPACTLVCSCLPNSWIDNPPFYGSWSSNCWEHLAWRHFDFGRCHSKIPACFASPSLYTRPCAWVERWSDHPQELRRYVSSPIYPLFWCRPLECAQFQSRWQKQWLLEAETRRPRGRESLYAKRLYIVCSWSFDTISSPRMCY